MQMMATYMTSCQKTEASCPRQNVSLDDAIRGCGNKEQFMCCSVLVLVGYDKDKCKIKLLFCSHPCLYFQTAYFRFYKQKGF